MIITPIGNDGRFFDLVLDFEDRAALDDYLKDEPYVVERVWEKIEIETINVVIANTASV